MTRFSPFVHACFGLMLSLAAASTLPAQPPELSARGRQAYEMIKDTRCFSSTAVGVAASTPPVVFAFRDLLEEPKADAALKALANEATPEGQLYALCGLWFTDPAAFQSMVKELRKSDRKITRMNGCMRGEETLNAVLESSEKDVVRLRDNRQTIKEWLESHSGKSMSYDIAGGAWPSMLRDEGGFRKPKRSPQG